MFKMFDQQLFTSVFLYGGVNLAKSVYVPSLGSPKPYLVAVVLNSESERVTFPCGSPPVHEINIS